MAETSSVDTFIPFLTYLGTLVFYVQLEVIHSVENKDFFSVTQILREIKLVDSKSAKSAIF